MLNYRRVKSQILHGAGIFTHIYRLDLQIGRQSMFIFLTMFDQGEKWRVNHQKLIIYPLIIMAGWKITCQWRFEKRKITDFYGPFSIAMFDYDCRRVRTFTPKMAQLQVNIPYVEHMGMIVISSSFRLSRCAGEWATSSKELGNLEGQLSSLAFVPTSRPLSCVLAACSMYSCPTNLD